MENILQRLRRGDVIIGDGALGTQLMKRGLKPGEPPEIFNLTKPQVLEEIASMYLEAGSEIITTNTFGASPLRLSHFSLDKDTEAINQAAVKAVRKAVGENAYVSASIGPTGVMIKPVGSIEPEKVYASFKLQVGSLLYAGVDMICIETMMDVREAELAIKAVRSLDAKIPVMATMTFGKTPRGFFTLMGSSVQEAASALESAGADIVGSNCGEGIENMIIIAQEYRKHSKLPIAIQSNAGLPTASKDGLVYPQSPDYMGQKAIELVDIGVQIIGGCCGTGPEHIRAIRNAVENHLGQFRLKTNELK